jgi:hypothetical protein
LPFQTFDQWQASGARVPAGGQGHREKLRAPAYVSHVEGARP